MQRRKRRARDIVLWGLAWLFALQLGLGAAIECGMWGFRDPFYQHKIVQLRRQWQEHGTSENGSTRLALMLGSSRTGNGLKGIAFEEDIYASTGQRWRIGNLAAVGAGPMIELIDFRRMLAEGIRPDFVLVEVMPLFLSEPLRECWLIKSERLALADLETLDECALPSSGTLRQGWWSDWTSPWYAHRFSILSELAPMFVPFSLQQNWAAHCDRTGWVAVPPNPNASAEQMQVLAKINRDVFEPSLRDFRPADASRKGLCLILEECRQRGIPAVLVLMPEGSVIRSWYTPATHAGVDAMLAELRADFAVPLIDARTWVADDGFCDQIHLLTTGADIFTRRLAQETAPMLRSSSESQAQARVGGR
jgi:hypothetical protein